MLGENSCPGIDSAARAVSRAKAYVSVGAFWLPLGSVKHLAGPGRQRDSLVLPARWPVLTADGVTASLMPLQGGAGNTVSARGLFTPFFLSFVISFLLSSILSFKNSYDGKSVEE